MGIEQPPQPDIRCVVCNMCFVQAHLENTYGCPNCGTIIKPAYIADDVMIVLNWRDARVLGNYAARWAQGFDQSDPVMRDTVKALENIIKRLEGFRPKKARGLLFAKGIPQDMEQEEVPEGCILSPIQRHHLDGPEPESA